MVAAEEKGGNFAIVRGTNLQTLVAGLNRIGLKPQRHRRHPSGHQVGRSSAGRPGGAMNTAPDKREASRPRLAEGIVQYGAALLAVAIVSIASSIAAHAQDGWAPVVVAAVPPQEPVHARDVAPRVSRSRLPHRGTASSLAAVTAMGWLAAAGNRGGTGCRVPRSSARRRPFSPKRTCGWLGTTASTSPTRRPTPARLAEEDACRPRAGDGQARRAAGGEDRRVSKVAGPPRRVLQEGAGKRSDDLCAHEARCRRRAARRHGRGDGRRGPDETRSAQCQRHPGRDGGERKPRG